MSSLASKVLQRGCDCVLAHLVEGPLQARASIAIALREFEHGALPGVYTLRGGGKEISKALEHGAEVLQAAATWWYPLERPVLSGSFSAYLPFHPSENWSDVIENKIGSFNIMLLGPGEQGTVSSTGLFMTKCRVIEAVA